MMMLLMMLMMLLLLMLLMMLLLMLLLLMLLLMMIIRAIRCRRRTFSQCTCSSCSWRGLGDPKFSSNSSSSIICSDFTGRARQLLLLRADSSMSRRGSGSTIAGSDLTNV
jgi:hypothetical protein